MLVIKKDNVEKIVPSGLYEDLYKAMGYEVIGGTVAEEKAAAPEEEVVAESKAEPTEEKPAFAKNDKKSEKVEK